MIKSDTVSKSLLSIFRCVDPNMTLTAACATGSYYFHVGSLKIRISNHFKKDVEKDVNTDVDMIKPIGGRSYLVSVKGSVFYAHMPLKIIRSFLSSENTRKTLFQSDFSVEPQNIQEMLNPGKMETAEHGAKSVSDFVNLFPDTKLQKQLSKYIDAHPEVCSEIKKFLPITDIRKHRIQHNENFGCMVSVVYRLIGDEYRKRDCTIHYQKSMSFVDFIRHCWDMKQDNPNSLHRV